MRAPPEMAPALDATEDAEDEASAAVVAPERVRADVPSAYRSSQLPLVLRAMLPPPPRTRGPADVLLVITVPLRYRGALASTVGSRPRPFQGRTLNHCT